MRDRGLKNKKDGTKKKKKEDRSANSGAEKKTTRLSGLGGKEVLPPSFLSASARKKRKGRSEKKLGCTYIRPHGSPQRVKSSRKAKKERKKLKEEEERKKGASSIPLRG